MELKIVARGNSKLQERKQDAERYARDKRSRHCIRSKFITHSFRSPKRGRKRIKVSQTSGQHRTDEKKLTFAEAYYT